MKRLTMILALLLMVTMPLFAERVTPEIARKVAATFLNNNGAKSAQLTDLSKAAGFANLYIFNAEQSFVVMAADDCVQPILGYSLTGKFVAENMPTNVSGWLQGYNDEIQYAVDSKMKATAETAKLWKDLISGNSKAGRATAVVNPLLQTTWDQNGIYGLVNGQIQLICELYNNLCPYDNNAGERTVTGCVATAMAQVMKYWGYPSSGIGSHSYTPTDHPEYGVQSANFGATTYDWANMPNALSQNSTATEINAIATLMYHCGVSVDMNYDISANGGSGAVSAHVPNALINYFNYKSTATFLEKSSYQNNDWIALLKSDLDASKPIQYSGRGTGGHAFVCDGYDNNNNFHFNWGWSGNNNGFYALTSLNPGSGGAGGSNYNFTNDQAAIIGIEPGSSIDATSLTYTLNGAQITLNWNAVNGASSYNVFRNNSLIENTTSTTYSETIPYGTTSYFVRCEDSNGQLSLPSNTITATLDYPLPIVNDLAGSLSGNNVNLTWAAPNWCYPAVPSAILTIGTQQPLNTAVSWSSNYNYWGHRHAAETISSYDGMRLYSIDFHVSNAGAYELLVFQGTTSSGWGYTIPSTQIASQSITVTETGWNSLDFSSPIIIDGEQDLWVFVHNTEIIEGLKSVFCTADGEEGCYYSPNLSNYTLNSFTNKAFLIKTYVTDGTYTYNLYDGTSQVASNINTTSYTVSNVANNTAHRYTVKTNYYGGETDASNMVGFALGNASLASLTLGANDMMTVTEGSKLTVNETLTNTNPANLILENGAELVHNSASVKATVKKTVTPPSDDDYGWYFIASPVTETVTPTAENGFLNGAYDLYYYNEPTYYWMNYEYSPFDINHQKGYLYANETTDGTTLQFAGTLTPSNNSVIINNLSHIASSLNGFNLVGNPFACNATVGEDFYVVNNTTGKVILASNTAEIAPCAGIFVKATENDASVTFTKATSSVEPSSSSFDIVVKRAAQPTKDGVPTGSTTLDRARVHLSDAEALEKFSIGDGEGSVIYFPQNGQDLAVACANGQNEMPLNFKAAKNGTYTLAFEVENLDLDYLHMIDNMTGEEVDVLAMPTYTFEAKTSDYALRFHLVFAENETEGASTGSAAFAYINNGDIIITGVEDACNASLQVVDMMGRVVLAGDAMNCVSTNGMTAGVYVLRLINGEQVKTQKIVVR